MITAAKHTRRSDETEAAPGEKPTDKVSIEGTEVKAVSPEGKTASLKLQELVQHLAPRRMDTLGLVLPDGVKLIFSEGPATILVHQTPPRVHNFLWISPDSPQPFGRGTQYRHVQIALPYVIVFAVFGSGPRGGLQLSGANECFFRNAPLSSPQDELLYPALLNISKFPTEEGHPLAWICTEKLNRARLPRSSEINSQVRDGLQSLLHCLFETGFNYSSENHEGSSHFTASKGIDPRIETVEAWEAATRVDPMFAVNVPWHKTNHTVTTLAERIVRQLGVTRAPVTSEADLARIVFNHGHNGLRQSLLNLTDLLS